MDKIWLKEYPAGVPAEIDPDRYPSLKALVEDSLQRYANNNAYVQMDRTLTYAQIEQQSRTFGAWLQSQGCAKGDRIAIMLPNLLQYPIAMFGAMRAGLVIVNTNPLYTSVELKHQLVDSGATTIIILENFCHVLEKVLHETPVKRVIVTAVGDLLGAPKSLIVNFVVRRIRKQVPPWHLPDAVSLRKLLGAARNLPLRPVELCGDDIAFLQYTGGTTGVSKGAELTHRNMVANTLQARAWHEQVKIANATYIIALPLYHIFSLLANCLLYTSVGGYGVLIPNPRDFPSFVSELIKHPPNTLNGVNTLFNALMNCANFSSIDFRGLVATMGGGMAVQATVAERWLARTGCPLTQGWGLTETSPVVTAGRLADKVFNGAVGLPLPSTEVSIRDDAGEDLGLEATGEICVRGPQVMRGYWHRDDETAQVMLPDGWLRTGDIGRIDSRGYVFIEDRKKDMISVSGFKVFPNEVEAVAASHPGVFEAAAVAQPDEHSGEAVALYVVRKDPALTAAELTTFMRESLTSYKVPRHVYFKDELPKTNVGKVLRRALRE